MINELAAVGHFIHRCAILPGCCLQCSCNVQLLNKEIGNWARILATQKRTQSVLSQSVKIEKKSKKYNSTHVEGTPQQCLYILQWL